MPSTQKQRGIADLWLVAIALICVLGLLFGIEKVWVSYINGIDAKGYARGVKETETKFVERDNAALAAANKRIEELTAQARAQEEEGQRKQDLLAQQREKDRQHAEFIHDRDVAAALNGTLGLRFPGKNTGSAARSNPDPGTKAGTAAGGGDGAATCELSRQANADLYALVDDADDVAKQLASAQQVIVQDRLTCNGGP